jgi:hypothetical protein
VSRKGRRWRPSQWQPVHEAATWYPHFVILTQATPPHLRTSFHSSSWTQHVVSPFHTCTGGRHRNEMSKASARGTAVYSI